MGLPAAGTARTVSRGGLPAAQTTPGPLAAWACPAQLGPRTVSREACRGKNCPRTVSRVGLPRGWNPRTVSRVGPLVELPQDRVSRVGCPRPKNCNHSDVKNKGDRRISKMGCFSRVALEPQESPSGWHSTDWPSACLHRRRGTGGGLPLGDWPLPQPSDGTMCPTPLRQEQGLGAIRRCVRRGPSSACKDTSWTKVAAATGAAISPTSLRPPSRTT